MSEVAEGKPGTVPSQEPAPVPPKGIGVRTSALRAYTMVVAVVAIWAIFWYTTEGTFLSSRNLSNLFRQGAVVGILSVGMLMIIVAGQIDLSVGSVVGLAGGLAAICQGWLGWDAASSIAVGLAVGLAVGAFHGSIVSYLTTPAFIVTLGGLLAWRGVIRGATQGNTIPISAPAFKSIGDQYVAPAGGWIVAGLLVVGIVVLTLRRSASRKRLGLEPLGMGEMVGRIVLPSALAIGFAAIMNDYAGIPIPVMILGVVALAGAVLTQNTVFGRYLYAIGGNPDAARLSGINIRRQTLVVFCIMGLLAGLAGVVYTARVGSGAPDAGVLLELDAIAACVIGGASLMGGRGTVFGALLGALFMASLDNGMSLENVSDYIQLIVKGVILVTAVSIDMMSRRRG
jgi:D-xylose transport system permease protein